MPELRGVIKEFIKEASFQNVNDADSLVQSRVLSSIIVVDLAVSFEDKFNIKIPFTEITKENFDTVILIENYLIAKGVTA